MNTYYLSRLLGSCILLAMFIMQITFAQSLPGPLAAGKQTLAPMLKQMMPAVVNVAATIPKDPQDPSFSEQAKASQNPFSSPDAPYRAQRPRNIESMGSGVIVDAEKGYVITNAHVIHKASSVSVTLGDGRHFNAKIIGADLPSDVAVLQIKARDLHSIPLGNSEKLEVGDFVLAIGNPFGLNQTVTSGIVSALQRSDLHIEGYENFIQTDAAINSGNSGGALITGEGQLVGINTAILTTTGGSVGIGFAIPINMVKNVMEQLIKYGAVDRGVMGVMMQNFTPTLSEALHYSKKGGAIITQITPDSPAQKVGLAPYDIIEKINDRPVQNAAEVRNLVGILRIGDKLKIDYFRDNQEKSVELTIVSPKQILNAIDNTNPLFTGVTMSTIDQQTASLHGRVQGVLILNINQGTPAARAQLLPGDVIISANRQNISDLTGLNKISQQKSSLLLRVYRGKGAIIVVLKK